MILHLQSKTQIIYHLTNLNEFMLTKTGYLLQHPLTIVTIEHRVKIQ